MPWYLFSKARREPRYKQLVVDLGFVDYFRATGVWNDFCRPVGSDNFECAD